MNEKQRIFLFKKLQEAFEPIVGSLVITEFLEIEILRGVTMDDEGNFLYETIDRKGGESIFCITRPFIRLNKELDIKGYCELLSKWNELSEVEIEIYE